MPPPAHVRAAPRRRRRHAAALVLGLRRDPAPRRTLLPRARCRWAGCWSARSPSGSCSRRAAGPRRTRREWLAAGRDRRAVVRPLQRRAERRRAAGRRRHRRDADPALPGAGRGAGRGVPQGEGHPGAGRRAARRVRRRGADRHRRPRRPRRPRPARGGPLPGLRGGVRRQPDPPEAAGRPAARPSRSPGSRARSARSPACRSPATWCTTPRPRAPPTCGWVVYLGVFPTAIAFSTYAFALSHMSAGSLSVTTYLVPPITVLLSWVLLSEAPPAMAYVGGALALVGVALARRKPRVARARGGRAGMSDARDASPRSPRPARRREPGGDVPGAARRRRLDGLRAGARPPSVGRRDRERARRAAGGRRAGDHRDAGPAQVRPAGRPAGRRAARAARPRSATRRRRGRWPRCASGAGSPPPAPATTTSRAGSGSPCTTRCCAGRLLHRRGGLGVTARGRGTGSPTSASTSRGWSRTPDAVRDCLDLTERRPHLAGEPRRGAVRDVRRATTGCGARTPTPRPGGHTARRAGARPTCSGSRPPTWRSARRRQAARRGQPARASRGTPRGCGSTRRGSCATPTPCGSRWRSRARGSC